MTVDTRLLVSDAQALTATAVSTDAIPVGLAGLDVGAGEPVGFAFLIDVAADVASANETYEFQIVGATASDLTTGQVILASRLFTTAQAASLTAGARFVLAFPVGSFNAGSITHLGARYVLTGTTPSATVTSFLTPLSAADERNLTVRSGFSVAS